MTGGMIVKKKYIATIMKKQKIGDERFVIYCDHAAIGDLDEETEHFIDENGNEFIPMISESILDTKYQNAYFNLVDFQKVKGRINQEVRPSVALTEFEKMCKKSFYYVGRGKDGKVFCGIVNTEEVEKMAEKQTVQETEQVIPEEEEGIMEVDPSNNTELDQLVEEILEGRFNKDELMAIASELELSLEQIQDIVDLIDSVTNKKEKASSVVSDEPEKKIDIQDLYEKVTRTLVAQDEPARRVITEIARKEMDPRKKKQGILLTGSSGVGKTELMRLIAKYIDRPFYTVNTAQLTANGEVLFIDESQRKPRFIEEILWDLYIKCGKDLKKTENAIIFFDDIDGFNKKLEGSDQDILDVLLPLISGANYDATEDIGLPKKSVRINTENMTVILGGTYSDVYKASGKYELGFLNKTPVGRKDRKLSTKDFVEYGPMTDGFMGKVTVIKLNELDIEDIKRVLLESDESEILIQQKIFKELGVKLTFTDGYITKVAEDAAIKKTGARGLNEIIDDTTWMAFDEVYSSPNTYKEIIVDEDTMENPSVYQKIENQSNKQLIKKRGRRSKTGNN